MRIPVYRSKATLSDRAPGARITARMNPTPFVNAELQKGAVLTAALGEAAKYTSMRYKMLVETQKNEAIFAAKEQLMELSNTLSNSRDIGNIFDGELKYQKGVDQIKKTLRQSVGQNKYALADFDNSFAQAEIPIRFRLKEVVDLKIDKRRQAALKAREEQVIQTLGVPDLDYTADDLAMELAQLETAYDQAELNGGASRTSIELNGMPVNQRVLIEAAKLALPAYGGTSLDDAQQLYEAFLEVERVRNGEKDAKKIAVSGEIPQHILNLMQAIPADVANGILLETMKQADTFYDLSQKLDEENLKAQNDLNTKAYNFALSVELGEDVSLDTMQQILNAKDYEEFAAKYPNGAIGAAVKYELQNLLENKYFWMNGSQQTALQKEVEQRIGTRKFAEVGDEAVFSRLYGTGMQGQLTVEELNRNSSSVTLAQHTTLRQLIESKSDEALNEGLAILSKRFFYNEKQAADGDDNLAIASKNAYMQTSGALLEEHNLRVSTGDPMTRSQIRQFAIAQHELFKDIYLEELQEEYEEFIEDWEATNIQTNFTIDRADPLGSIERWYGNLSDTEQQQKATVYGVFRAQVKARFGKRGLF
tara:strand:+ start:485 stop:2260 length:1776 start_codon:yes stop_codon:yes gene_type:complete